MGAKLSESPCLGIDLTQLMSVGTEGVGRSESWGVTLQNEVGRSVAKGTEESAYGVKESPGNGLARIEERSLKTVDLVGIQY